MSGVGVSRSAGRLSRERDRAPRRQSRAARHWLRRGGGRGVGGYKGAARRAAAVGGCASCSCRCAGAARCCCCRCCRQDVRGAAGAGLGAQAGAGGPQGPHHRGLLGPGLGRHQPAEHGLLARLPGAAHAALRGLRHLPLRPQHRHGRQPLQVAAGPPRGSPGPAALRAVGPAGARERRRGGGS